MVGPKKACKLALLGKHYHYCKRKQRAGQPPPLDHGFQVTPESVGRQGNPCRPTKRNEERERARLRGHAIERIFRRPTAPGETGTQAQVGPQPSGAARTCRDAAVITKEGRRVW